MVTLVPPKKTNHFLFCSGAWLVGATYMSWSLGGEIITGLESSTSHAKKE